MLRQYRIHVGVDLGAKTGWAVWDRATRKFLQVETLPAWKLFETIYKLDEQMTLDNETYLLSIEDPRKMKIPPGRIGSEARLQGVGAVKWFARQLELFCEANAIPYQMKRPNPKYTKLDPEYFRQMTGWTGRTSNHARDACMMVYGI